MFALRWRILRLFGIPVYLDLTWLLILALFTLTLSQKFHDTIPDLPPPQYWVMGFVAALCFFACIVLHELGHALAARSSGMPIRGITLFLFGGVAELQGEPPSARSEFVMAIAGPIVSAVLAAVCFVLALLGPGWGWPVQVWLVLRYLAVVNLVVLVFNPFPAFPLDGGRVLRSVLWAATGDVRRATHWSSLLGQGFGWLLVTLGVLQFFTGNWVGGVWTGLIGMFLLNAARASYQNVLLREALRGEPV